jgi:hypothetical protein
MTAWVLIVFVSVYGEYAVPGIESKAECMALYQKIKPGSPPERSRCIEYRIGSR